jgi:hypothetical protein
MAKKEIPTINTRKIDVNYMIHWCKENGKVDWLKGASQRIVEHKIYPQIKNEETGRMVADKTAAPEYVNEPISFIELKQAFITECLGVAPKGKEKKPTFYDKIAAL